MEYKFKKRKYDLRLNDDGKIECVGENIVGNTVDEVKAAIRASCEKEEAKPRISVLTFGDGYRRHDFEYFEGTTSGEDVGRYQSIFWVSYKDEKGKNQRAKMNGEYVYADTPENRTALDRLVAHRREIRKMELEENELLRAVVTLEEQK